MQKRFEIETRAVAIGALLSLLTIAPMPVSAQQLPRDSKFAQQRPNAAPAAPPAPAAPTAPQHTETTVYDAWTVSCQDLAGGKKNCLASFPVYDEQRRQILNWVITRNPQGGFVAIVQAPQISAGILLEKGVQLKLGAAAARKLPYTMCASNQCQASSAFDDAMMKELFAAQNAVVTIVSATGQDVNINISGLKGADRAVAALGK